MAKVEVKQMPSDDNRLTACDEFFTESRLAQIKRLAKSKLWQGNCSDSETHAEDVAHEVYVNAKEAWNTFRSPEAMVYRITKNAASDHARKCRREAPQEIDEGAVPSFTLYAQDPSSGYEQSRLIEELLALLDPVDEKIIDLRFQGLTFDEIAVLLDKPSNTVRSRYRRALQHLNRQANGPLPDPIVATD